MNKEDTEKNIERVITNRVNAKIYSLDNFYLEPIEKIEVEKWYQFPGDIMNICIILLSFYSIFNTFSLLNIIVISALVNIFFGIINWFFYSKKVVNFLYITILHSWVLYVLGIGVSILLFTQGFIILGIVNLLYPFGILSFFELHIFFYPFLSLKYKMHPKYAFFKKNYNHKFPFEIDLE